MRRVLESAAVLFGIACATACADEHSLTIRVVTGLVPGPEFSLVRVDLLENSASFESERVIPGGAETLATFGVSFAQGRRVAEFSDLTPGVYTVRVQLRRPDDSLLIQRRVRTTVGADSVVTVHLTRDCVGVTCPSPLGSAAFSECLAGRCVSPECEPPNESDACGGIVFCNDAAGCGPTSACALQTCDEGICTPAGLEGACPETEWCDPDVGDGCTPYTILDGGVAVDAGGDDASVGDAGVDGSAQTCGGACVISPTSCVAGYWDCAGETPVCARLGLRPVSASCGEDAVCNALGVCTPCRAGAECRIGCSAGAVSCAHGFEECALTSPASVVAAGTSCALDSFCVDGDSCGRGNYCDSTSVCVSCSPGSACLSGCARGTVDCTMSGACVATGAFADAGESCGTDMHCTADHTCVACVEGATCISPDPCANGQISCAAGEPACVAVSARLSPGSACGTDQVCDSHFTCQHCVFGEACAAGECMNGTLSCFGGVTCYPGGYTSAGTVCVAGECNGLGECYAPYEASDIVMGDAHTCALHAGSLQCWGENSSGQLGVAASASTLVKADVPLLNVAQFSLGVSYSCAVDADGIVYCWGANYAGTLGDGTTDTRATPTAVDLPGPARAVTAGSSHTCAVLVSGEVWCWGLNNVDEFGTPTYDTLPLQRTGVANVVQVASGASDYDHSCARTDDGHVWCWGTNYTLQLGASFSSMYEATPVEVLGIDDAVDISLAPSFGCALRASGEVWCWGGGEPATFLDPGIDGSGVVAQRVVVPFTEPIQDIAVGTARVCALTVAGDLWCWGINYSFMLGVVGIPPNFENLPTPVSNLSHVAQFSIGEGTYSYSGCAVTDDGDAACWGANYSRQCGQDPDLGFTELESPVNVRTP